MSANAITDMHYEKSMLTSVIPGKITDFIKTTPQSM